MGNFDIYGVIADRIIAEMEKGEIPWQKPWVTVAGGAVKHRDGKPYSLLNQILLGEQGEYLSFKECQAAGGKVKKGAKARMVVFFKFVDCEQKDENGRVMRDSQGKPLTKQVPFLRYSNVFHIKDTEGIAPKWQKDVEQLTDTPADDRAEQVIAEYTTREGVGFENVKQNGAYYSPAQDRVTLPIRAQFTSTAEYYSAAFHELTHSTGHPKRLNRFDIGSGAAAFGSASYSKEELVAEIGAAAMLNQIGLETPESFKNSAGYIQGWLKALKNDKRLFVSAACKADKAVRMILDA